MGLFDGFATRLAAAQPMALDDGYARPGWADPALVAAPQPRKRGLFGSLGSAMDLSKPNLFTFLMRGTDGLDRARGLQEEKRQREALSQITSRLSPDLQLLAAAAPGEALKRAYPIDEYAVIPEGGGVLNKTTGSVVQAPTTKAPSGYRPNDDGTLSYIPGGPGDPRTIALAAGARRDDRAPAPKDYRYTASGDLEAIPGGKAWRKERVDRRKADSLKQQLEGSSANVFSAINRARKLANSGLNTGIGAVASGIPGSQAHDLASAINTVVANIGFDKLSAMRASSPTGGALGSVTEKELQLLQDVIASLKQSQSKGQFLENLSRVETQYRRTLTAFRDAYEEDYGAAQSDDGGDAALADPLGIR